MLTHRYPILASLYISLILMILIDINSNVFSSQTILLMGLWKGSHWEVSLPHLAPSCPFTAIVWGFKMFSSILSWCLILHACFETVKLIKYWPLCVYSLKNNENKCIQWDLNAITEKPWPLTHGYKNTRSFVKISAMNV